MNKKYEISVWKDTYINDRWEEEKLIVIGSDTMTSQSRARDPKLVSNINGTNTFTFVIYYSYIDVETGELVRNPFVPFLVNERKIKVYWKNKWYDLLIKKIKEDSVNHTFTYTCEDQYLTELSRSGFGLEFNSQLQNNIGTPEELVNKVIKDTDWQFDRENSDVIYQTSEEAVYEVNAVSNFEAKENPLNTTVTISSGTSLLVFYSCAPAAKEDALKKNLQFAYPEGGIWKQDDNDMLVLNGKCCNVEVTWAIDTDENKATAYINDVEIFTISFSNGVSKKYRAERYVDSQKTVFSPIVNRYVSEYITNEGQTIYGYETTDFNDASTAINIITNPSNFSNASGWIKDDEDKDGLIFKIAPPFDKNTVVAKYEAKSYLRVCKGRVYKNSGIQNNRSYIKNGFSVGEKYIFRYRCVSDNNGLPSSNSYVTPNLEPRIQGMVNDIAVAYFDQLGDIIINNNWVEFRLICTHPCSYDDLLTINKRPVISLNLLDVSNDYYWLEEIQFFKEVFDGNNNRINPNELDKQSVATVVYHYFDAATTATSIDELEFISGDSAQPVMNNFQRFGTIEASQSNRFNILQDIAETFKCWVRFRVDHDEEGHIKRDEQGALKKYVQLKSEVGQDSGLTFVYGIDLQGVVRDIVSSSISTKTIVSSNSNEFGKNGFCSIARSEQNYSRENVIYNFDYYIQQGLLDREDIETNLYNYYNTLHDNNVEYMKNLETLTQKNTELTRQKAQQIVYDQYLSSAQQEKANVENDLIKLTGAKDIDEALEYAKRHLTNQKVQSLINDRSYIINSCGNYSDLLDSVGRSIESLNGTISELNNRQATIIENLTIANTDFYKKYSRFIQEGTWNSEDYYNDDLYYLDALQVAYESSRPQINYTINVLRISDTVDFSSKVFELADIAYIQDTEYFGYKDKFTPYKEKVFLSEVTSFFDSPEKDSFKVQNYLTQFDDLFQRITAATQNLEFSQGKYAKAANIVATDGTIKASVIQETFDSNTDLVYGAQNEAATIDNTGITVTSNDDGSKLVRVTSGGIFVSSDGGETWRNAIRGDGITADLLTAGRINTQEIDIYNSDVPSFHWDSSGINAYGQEWVPPIIEDGEGHWEVDTSRFVRFDQFGVYGMRDVNEEFKPTSLSDIYNSATFGMTWEKFFIKNAGDTGGIEISSDNDIVVKAAPRNEEGVIIPGAEWIDRVKIGKLGDTGEYGLQIKDNDGQDVFLSNSKVSMISGWKITQEGLVGKTDETKNQYIEIKPSGGIGCVGGDEHTYPETAYQTTVASSFKALNLKTNQEVTLNSGMTIYVFGSTIGKITTTYVKAGDVDSSLERRPPAVATPQPSNNIYIGIESGSVTNNFKVTNDDKVRWIVELVNGKGEPQVIDPTEPASGDNLLTTYTYTFRFSAVIDGNLIFTVFPNSLVTTLERYVPKADNAWTIDDEGNAIFHNIFADGGQIAGWYIDGQRIYQTWDGTPNTEGNNIKVELNSAGLATKDGIDYSIVTDAINAAMANIGGVLMSGGLVNGYNIAEVMSKAKSAASTANAALSAVRTLQNRFNGHRHQYTRSSSSTGQAEGHSHPISLIYNQNTTGPV